MADVFGRAIRDYAADDLGGPLIQRDGDERREHPIEAFYFTDLDPAHPYRSWWDGRPSGPLLDVGAGAGTDALHWQADIETVAIDVSRHLVELMRDRGVADARRADMFALTEHFERNRFESATARGTQLGLAGSREGLAQFLADLATVTTDDATAILDAYDPSRAATADLLGYRADPAAGLAFRVFQFTYDGEVGETLLFRLFSPSRLRDATTGTAWSVVDVVHPDAATAGYYAAKLAK